MKPSNKILCFAPIRTLLFLFSFCFLAVVFVVSLETLSKWWALICIVCNLITIILLLLFCKKHKSSFSKFVNYRKGKTGIKSAFFTTLIMIFVGMCGMWLSGFICYGEFPYFATVMVQPLPIWVAGIILILLPITTTLAEDGLYLGIINQNSTAFSIFIVAFFYAFQHSFIPFLPDFQFIAYRFLSFLPLTILLCLWYKKSKNPLPFMTGHFILNLATAIQILIISN